MKDGRSSEMIKKVLGEGLRDSFVNQSLYDSLQRLHQGFKEGQFSANAQSYDEAVLRAKTILGDLPNAQINAEKYTKDGASGLDADDEETLFRIRLLSEMNFTARRGGVILPNGRIDEDVVGAVLTVVKEIKPELNIETLSESNLGEKKT